MIKRTESGEYEKLVDVVIEHDAMIKEITLNEGDVNW